MLHTHDAGGGMLLNTSTQRVIARFDRLIDEQLYAVLPPATKLPSVKASHGPIQNKAFLH